jgi:hypothetical protein
MLITPPQMHISLQVLSSAGALARSTVGAPGTQGAGVLGMQGMGVKAPIAAAVAAATIGLANDWHMPKGAMFIMGTLSRMLPAGMLLVITFLGVALKEEGAMPKLHWSRAPVHT